MTWKDRRRERMVNHFGDGATCTIRRRTGAGLRSAVLVLQASIAEDDTEITITGNAISGRIPAGCAVSIAGDATVYTVAEDAFADPGSQIAVLTVTPAIAQASTVGAAVTVASGAESVYPCAQHRLSDDVAFSKGVRHAVRKVAVIVPRTEKVLEGDRFEDDSGIGAIAALERHGNVYTLMIEGAT